MQTAGFSDDQLIKIFTAGVLPDGAYFDDEIVSRQQWSNFHRWTMTPEQATAMVVYLRSLTPESQKGTRADFGGRVMRPDGGLRRRWRLRPGRRRRGTPATRPTTWRPLTRRPVRYCLLLGILLGGVGCGDGADLAAVGPLATADAGASAPGFAPTLPAHCAAAAVPPATLECTGLYANLAAKTLTPGVREYAPAYVLWSDGADKRRWIGLPAGSVIDASDPNEWVFPIGTRVWKEFSLQGQRVETRLWQKVTAKFWVNAVYVWNQEQSAALR